MITDRASRKIVTTRVEMDPTPAALADFVSKACQDFGIPERLTTDGGMEYMSTAFREMVHTLGISWVVQQSGHPSPTSF
jgi:hypothetical protein